MYLAQELINDSGISVIGAAFFTGLFGMVGAVIVALINARHKVEELKDVTVKAAESAKAAQSNTQNVSNGFVNRMDKKLDNIASSNDELNEKFDQLSTDFRKHLEWHLSKET